MAFTAKIRGEPLNRGDVIRDQDGRRWRFEFVSAAGQIFAVSVDRRRSRFLPAESFIDVTLEKA